MSHKKTRLLALALLSSISFSTVSFADSIENWENQKQEKQNSINEVQNSINSLEEQKQSLSNEVNSLDTQIGSLEAQISALTSQISGLEIDIKETETEIKNLQDKITKNKKEFEDRISVMYKNRNVGYLDLLFSSSNVDDLLAKTSTMKFVTEYDKEILNELKNDKLVVDAKKSELNGKKASLEISKQNLADKNAELYSSKASKLASIKSAEDQQANSKEEISSLENEVNTLENNISTEQNAREERARAQAQAAEEAERVRQLSEAQAAQVNMQVNNNTATEVSSVATEETQSQNVEEVTAPISADVGSVSNNLGSGTLGWPVPASRNITSGYGYRSFGGMSDFHLGIDIASGTGTPVVSADGGTVISAAYEGSYGNIVKVQHDSGLVTYYAHLSSFVASPGQRVEKGQVIALMGSTGNSTGPHLHFEVRVNGAHVNPLGYVQ